MAQALINDFRNRLLRQDNRLLDFIVRLAALAYLLNYLLIWPHYISASRLFAPTPLLPLPLFLLQGLFAAQVLALAMLCIRPRHWQAAAVVSAVTLLQVMADISCLQPFTLMYSFVVLAAALPAAGDSQRLQALRLMIIGVYFWAGVSKLNASFFSNVFPWFIKPLWDYDAHSQTAAIFVTFLSLGVPVFELLIGVLLLSPRHSRLASLMALVMLVTVTLCIGPTGWNWDQTVWAWNYFLFFCELCLFLAPHAPPAEALRTGWLPHAAALLFFALPALGPWGLWPAGVSFQLYSGNVPEARIELSHDELPDRLPQEIRAVLGSDKSFNVNSWVMIGATGLLTYADYRVFATGALGLCPYLRYPQEARLVLLLRPAFYSTLRDRRVQPLCPATGL